MEELTLGFTDIKELYRCYMPFFKNGGLFVRSARHYKMGQSLALSVTLPDALEPASVWHLLMINQIYPAKLKN
jgi:type IV pilus assembly protein PilZ